MTEEVRKGVFDPFFTTKRAEGSGLGTSIAYGVITGHGGKIEVESEVGKGTTFTMSIPIARETPQQAVSPEPRRKIKVHGLCILVIDDDKEICSILNKYFSKDGHDVKSVNSGTEAIKLLKNEGFDLVLCDLIMPGITGYDIVKVIDELDKKPKVGLITGWDEKIETKSKEVLNVDFIIRKPFDFSKLASHINEILGAG
jgi:CheY-like chemotaxis protein